MERSLPARPPAGSLELLWRPFEALGSLARSAFVTISSHRRLRVALLALLVSLPLLGGGWVLLRRSSFVAVEHVRVSGVHGPQARAIDAALEGAALHMSTLDLRPGALRAAVSSFPVVRGLRMVPRFPHGLSIEVSEQLPVAALTIGGSRTAVAADGVVLGPTLLRSSLAALSAPGSAIQPQAGQHVQGASLLADLNVLGAAPRSLARFAARVFTSPKNQGLTVAMKNGLLVYFGDATRAHAKWAALARVLADSSSAGATYVDVRVPERPAAGFTPGGALRESATSTGQSNTPESTVAALAAGLSHETSGTAAPSAAAGTSTEPAPGASTGTEAPAGTSTTAEAASGTGASTEASSGTGSSTEAPAAASESGNSSASEPEGAG